MDCLGQNRRTEEYESVSLERESQGSRDRRLHACRTAIHDWVFVPFRSSRTAHVSTPYLRNNTQATQGRAQFLFPGA